MAAFEDLARTKYTLAIAVFVLLAAMAPGLQRHMVAEPDKKVIFDSEGLTIPASTMPAGACAAVEEQALQDCDRMMEETWYQGGAIEYQRQQHLKDFPRCQTLSINLFHACNNYGH